MNKLIKWVIDLYYSQQRKPDEPKITYQEKYNDQDRLPILDHYQCLYAIAWGVYGDIYITKQYECLYHHCVDSPRVRILEIGIPIISLIKYIDKMFQEDRVIVEKDVRTTYFYIGEYTFNDSVNMGISRLVSLINMKSEEILAIKACLIHHFKNHTKNEENLARQAMEDKLQGLLKDLE